MRPLVLALLASFPASAAEGVGWRMSSGWQYPIDVPGLERLLSADPTVVSVSSLGPDQATLLGVMPGETVISVWANGQRTDFPILVLRNTTVVQRLDGLVKAAVGHPTALKVKDLKRVELGDASLADAAIDGADAIALKAKRPGTTTMLVWAGGLTAAHRTQLLVTFEAGGIARSADEVDATLTEPFGRLVLVSGEHAVVDVPADDARFAVKDEGVAVLRMSALGDLVIEGRAPGATRLLLWKGTKQAKSLFVVVHPRAPADAPVDDPIAPDDAPVPVQTL